MNEDSITVRADQLGSLSNFMSEMTNRSSISFDCNGFHTTMESCLIYPRLIKTIGRKTFVTWNDGTTTKVVCDHNKPYDMFSGFCAAFAKRMYGGTTKLLRVIDTADEKAIKRREHETNQIKHQERMKREKEKFEAEVEKKRHELAVLREAEKRLATKGE